MPRHFAKFINWMPIWKLYQVSVSWVFSKAAFLTTGKSTLFWQSDLCSPIKYKNIWVFFTSYAVRDSITWLSYEALYISLLWKCDCNTDFSIQKYSLPFHLHRFWGSKLCIFIRYFTIFQPLWRSVYQNRGRTSSPLMLKWFSTREILMKIFITYWKFLLDKMRKFYFFNGCSD